MECGGGRGSGSGGGGDDQHTNRVTNGASSVSVGASDWGGFWYSVMRNLDAVNNCFVLLMSPGVLFVVDFLFVI
jgi:hypothetical protein